MADEKADKNGGQDGRKRGRRLLPFLLVAVGAAIGGAGVVFLGPRPQLDVPQNSAPELAVLQHPDPMDFTFNPQVERGQKNAIVTFLFEYKLDKRNEAQVLDEIKKHWSRAYSRCLLVLKSRSVNAFNAEGLNVLRKELADELTASLFPDGIAEVHDILWRKVMVQ